MPWLCKVCMPKCSATVSLAIVHHIFKHNHSVSHKSDPVLDLPLCLGVIKHRALLARGAHLPAKHCFAMDCGAILAMPV